MNIVLLLASLFVVAQPSPTEVVFDAADGGRIVAEVHGEGDNVVVLAHGAAFNKESRTPQARALVAQGHRVLAITFRGYGASTAGPVSIANPDAMHAGRILYVASRDEPMAPGISVRCVS